MYSHAGRVIVNIVQSSMFNNANVMTLCVRVGAHAVDALAYPFRC